MGEISEINIEMKVNNTIREKGRRSQKEANIKIVTVNKGKMGIELKKSMIALNKGKNKIKTQNKQKIDSTDV